MRGGAGSAQVHEQEHGTYSDVVLYLHTLENLIPW